MASIKTVINIQDRMTPAFASMNRALNVVISSFDQLQRDTGHAVDISSLKHARDELALVDIAMDDVESEIRQATSQQQKFNDKIRQGQSASDGLLKKVVGFVGAYAGIQAIGKTVNLSDQMSQTESKLKMILDEQTDIEKMEDMIFQAAQNSRSEYQSTADMIGRIGNNAKGVFKSNAELVKFAETLNKKYIIAGASSEEMNNSLIQLTQGLGSGVLRGEELNSVFESAPNIIQTIADYLNVPIGKIREMAADGELSADVVKNAILSSIDETNAQFNQMSMTWGQRWTMFKNEALFAFQPILNKINEVANSQAFDALFNGAIVGMRILGNIASKIIAIISKGASLIAKAWGAIAPLFIGAAAAVTTYYIALGIMKGIEMVSAGIKWAMTAAQAASNIQSWAGVKAIIALKAAQWGFNTALLACPIFWIVIAIIAMVAILYLGVWALNEFAGTSISATGVVAGVFFALGQYLYNMVAFAWNIFASFAEFLVNLFIDPVSAVKGLFANLATSVIDMVISMTEGWDEMATNLANGLIEGINIAIGAVNWLIDAINLIPGIDLDHIGEFEKVGSITTSLKGTRDNIKKWAEEGRSENYWEAPKMEMGSIGGAFDAGYEWGSNLEKGIGDMFANGDLSSNIEEEFSGIKDATDKAADSGKKTAGNTAQMAKTMNASSEDLKYLRDIAERETINRFTTAEIKIDMTNNNNINSDMDIDGVIDKLTERVHEELLATAEGVHS